VIIPLSIAPEDVGIIRSRFLAKVKQGDGCWLWTGYTQTPLGRGRMRINNRVYYAYRVAYVLEHGSIPAGYVVCHHCDNPQCVRSDHLFAGLQADNVRDMHAKKRGRNNPPCGIDHHKVTVSDERVAWAKQMYTSGQMNQSAIAEVLGVTQQTISDWVRGHVRRPRSKGLLIAQQRDTAADQLGEAA